MTTKSFVLNEAGTIIQGNVSACQSWRPSSFTCADGFVQRPFCGGRTGCPTCDAVSDAHLPDCLRDEVPEHLSRDDGLPLFYRAALAAGKGEGT